MASTKATSQPTPWPLKLIHLANSYFLSFPMDHHWQLSTLQHAQTVWLCQWHTHTDIQLLPESVSHWPSPSQPPVESKTGWPAQGFKPNGLSPWDKGNLEGGCTWQVQHLILWQHIGPWLTRISNSSISESSMLCCKPTSLIQTAQTRSNVCGTHKL